MSYEKKPQCTPAGSCTVEPFESTAGFKYLKCIVCENLVFDKCAHGTVVDRVNKAGATYKACFDCGKSMTPFPAPAKRKASEITPEIEARIHKLEMESAAIQRKLLEMELAAVRAEKGIIPTPQ